MMGNEIEKHAQNSYYGEGSRTKKMEEKKLVGTV